MTSLHVILSVGTAGCENRHEFDFNTTISYYHFFCFLKKLSWNIWKKCMKSTNFGIFEKQVNMYKMVSAIHMANMKLIRLFLIPKWSKKRQKMTPIFVMRFFFWRCILRTSKCHHSIQHEKLHWLDAFFISKQQA